MMTFLIIIIYALGVLFNIVGVIISAIDNKEENIVEIQLAFDNNDTVFHFMERNNEFLFKLLNNAK